MRIEHNQYRWFGASIVVVALVSAAGSAQAQCSRPARDKSAASMTPRRSVETAAVGIPKMIRTPQLISVEVPDTIPVIRSDNSTRAGGAASDGAEAYVYKNDYDSGYAIVLNFTPSTGALFPGTMMADEMILGNGFVPGGTISAYEVEIIRSEADPTNGLTLATYHLELWDGDPLGMIDLPGEGYLGAKIAGTEATFTDVPGPGVFRLRADLPTPVTIPHQRVWLILYGEDTCRTGWRISGQTPDVGDILRGSSDVSEAQEDYDGQFNGLGHCCNSGVLPFDEPCDLIADPCTADTTGRGFCTDMDAESAGTFWFGGPCVGSVDDNCASFVAKVWAPTDTTISLVPKRSSGPSIISGNEITLGPEQQLWLEIEVAGWDPDLDGTPKVARWAAQIDSAGYVTGQAGTLTPWNPACTSDADCETLLGTGSRCNLPDFPPGGCSPGFLNFGQDPACPDMSQGCLQLDTPASNITMLDYIYGSLSYLGNPATDDGSSHYAGTLVLEALSGTKGTFTIGFDHAHLDDANRDPIPLVGHIPAKITVEDTRCCYGMYTPDAGCVKGLTAVECADLYNSRFQQWGSCDDPCPECRTNEHCDDQVPCSAEYCDTATAQCVYNLDHSMCDDGDPCTGDVCREVAGCVNPILPSGSTCDDEYRCTYDDVCDGMDPPACAGQSVASVSCDTPADCQAATGTAWECVDATCFCDPCIDAQAPGPEPTPIVKNRYLSFGPGNPGQTTALRVMLVDLPRPFEAHEGTVMWVGNPAEICENSHQVWPPCDHPASSFMTARLQCGPVYRDWGDMEALHVYGLTVLPGARYEVQAITLGCAEGDEGSYSAALLIDTGLWGDVTGNCPFGVCTPPDNVVDFGDIVAMVDKFRDMPTALAKARADLDGLTGGVLDHMVRFTDISSVVDAFIGYPYPFEGPQGCP